MVNVSKYASTMVRIWDDTQLISQVPEHLFSLMPQLEKSQAQNPPELQWRCSCTGKHTRKLLKISIQFDLPNLKHGDVPVRYVSVPVGYVSVPEGIVPYLLAISGRFPEIEPRSKARPVSRLT